MAVSSPPRYKWIKVTEPVYVRPVKRVPANSYIIVIMGLTGVGKSNFIESFSSTKSKLGISGGNLESVTQELAAYKLVNIKLLDDHPIFLVDTPGFSDPNLSEMTIIRKLQGWMRSNNIEVVNHILFLDRITDTRIPGSKGKVFDMFKVLTGSGTANNITIVTTMWDEFFRPSQTVRAEERFQQMSNNHWKPFIDQGARILKFENTQRSALHALDQCLLHSIREYFDFAQAANDGQNIQQTRYAASIIQILRDRVNGRYLEYCNINDDLSSQGAATPCNKDLVKQLLKQRQRAETDLTTLVQELKDCGVSGEKIAEEWPGLPAAPLVVKGEKNGILQKLQRFLKWGRHA